MKKNFIITLIYLVLLTICVTGYSASKYEVAICGSDSATVAKPIIVLKPVSAILTTYTSTDDTESTNDAASANDAASIDEAASNDDTASADEDASTDDVESTDNAANTDNATSVDDTANTDDATITVFATNTEDIVGTDDTASTTSTDDTASSEDIATTDNTAIAEDAVSSDDTAVAADPANSDDTDVAVDSASSEDNVSTECNSSTVNLTDIEKGITLSNLQPGSKLVYYFEIRNFNDSNENQILLKYSINVSFDPDSCAIPLTYELTPANSNESAIGKWSYLHFGSPEVHSYKLVVIWETEDDDVDYIDQQQNIKIEINAEQVDS